MCDGEVLLVEISEKEVGVLKEDGCGNSGVPTEEAKGLVWRQFVQSWKVGRY